MPRKLTPWQRLARIAYRYKIRTRGLDVNEIADALLRHGKVTEDDKQRVREILKEWMGNNQGCPTR